MQKLEARQDQMPATRSSGTQHSSLDHEAAATPDHALAGKLSPSTAARVREAAAAITGSQPRESREGEAKAPADIPKVESRNAEVRTV